MSLIRGEDSHRYAVFEKVIPNQKELMEAIRKLSSGTIEPPDTGPFKPFFENAINVIFMDAYLSDLDKIEYFNFGEMTDEVEKSIFNPIANKVFEKGLLNLPYKTVLYILSKEDQRNLLLIHRISTPPGKDPLVPEGSLLFINLVNLPFLGTTAYALDAVLLLKRDLTYEPFDRANLPFDRNHEDALINFGLMLTMILNTKNIILDRRIPSKILQERRKRKKKNPLPIITYIDLEKYREARENTGRTHASPVPHLRRGHIRRIPPTRWHPEGKEVWIKDCLVNCRSLDEITEREEYRVRT